MKRSKIPLEKPQPDFAAFRSVVEGKEKAGRVHFAELLMDVEIKKYITENLLGARWTPLSPETKEDYWRQDIDFWYRMGYDYIRVSGGLDFPMRRREIRDTAALAREKRSWAEEGTGPIASWEDFEKYSY